VSSSERVTGLADRTDAHKDVVSRLFEAFTERRFDDAAELMTADATWWMLSHRRQVPVRDWLAGYDKQAGALFPGGLRFELVTMTAEDNRVAVQAHCRGTTKAGVEYHNEYHFLFAFDGGLIRTAWEYGDTLHAKQIFAG
jgi:ketosteroid isomerase-like protein